MAGCWRFAFELALPAQGGSMKLVSFAMSGRASWGVVTGTGVIDMGRRLGAEYPSLRALLAADAIAAVAEAARAAKPDHVLSEVRLLPPIPDPDKIICLGNNYRAHVLEGGNKIPEHPQLFIRLANSLVGHEAPIIVPKISHELDYEGELAVVIGRGGRHIAEARALAQAAGYTRVHRASARDRRPGRSAAPRSTFL